jgi:predicted RNA-binding protein with TRAM domain
MREVEEMGERGDGRERRWEREEMGERGDGRERRWG